MIHRLTRLAAVAVVAALGCEVAGTTAPDLEPRPVVHAVLNTTTPEQVVIVERTLRSSAPGLGGGRPYEPVTDARVVVYGPRQDSVIATQASGNADGIYRFQSVTITDGSAGPAPPNVLRLRPGERYRLRVETSIGTALGETVIPAGGAPDAARRTFNVDRDTLRLTVPAVAAAGYLLRHESNRGGLMERYVTALDMPLILPLAQAATVPDEQRWAFAFARVAMLPGIPQNFIVVALDSNYFRYYVAAFDPFGDDTRGNTLTGGVGLFGAVAPLLSKTLDLVADIDTPVEGTWTADRGSATLPSTLTLYSSPYFPTVPNAGRAWVSGRGRTAMGQNVEATGEMELASGAMFLNIVAPGGETGSFVRADGLLGPTTLVLTDVQTRERLTYRKR